MKDQNGKKLYRNVKQRSDGLWGVNVWSGDGGSQCRKYYRTKVQARNGDISHDKKHGVVDGGAYL